MLNIVLLGLLGMVFMTALEYFYLKNVVNHKHWFNYESIDIMTDEYRELFKEAGGEPILLPLSEGHRTHVIGEPIQMVSNYQVNRGTTLKWRDVLRCDPDGIGKYAFYSSQEAYDFTPKRHLQSITWLYGQSDHTKLPDRPMDCVIVADISAPNKWGIEHVQTVTSPIISFVNK